MWNISGLTLCHRKEIGAAIASVLSMAKTCTSYTRMICTPHQLHPLHNVTHHHGKEKKRVVSIR
jgi:hypothetical protein